MKDELYTIGHSNHSIKKFIELLSKHSIKAICDVRSRPYSKYSPQFNRETLRNELENYVISYVFLGKELGPKSDNPECYVNGKVQYRFLTKTDIFQRGIDRLLEEMKTHRIALMCAEKDPIMCHRTIFVCRYLHYRGITIKHILEDGSLENNTDSERRLMQVLKIPEEDLFVSSEKRIEDAYDLQSEKIVHIIDSDNSTGI